MTGERLCWVTMRLFAAALLAYANIASALPHSPDPLRIDPAAERIPLSAHIERLEDPDGRLTLDEVRAPERAQQYVAGSSGIGYSASAWWLRLRVHNDGDTPLERRLDLGNRTLQEIELYVSTPDGSWQRQATGSTLPFRARPIASGNFALTLTLAPQATTEIYLRLRSTGYQGVVVTPSLWQAAAHQQAWQDEVAIWTLAIGILLALALVNLFLYVYVRERSYLLYVLAILSYLTGVNSASGGYGGAYAYLWPTSPVFEQTLWVIAILISAIFPVWFIAELVDVRRQQPRLWRFILICQGLLFLAISLQVAGTIVQRPDLGHWLQRFYLIGAMFWTPIYPAIILAAAKSWRQGERMARFLAVGYAPVLMSIVVGAWWLIQGKAFPWTFAIVAAIFEGLVMAMALADRFLAERRAKFAAQVETIVTLQRSERELETKVAERTKQLTASEERTKDLLHNILPASVATELATSGKAEPVELKSATILFTDFAGFTQAASTMPAERMVTELNDIFSAFDDICRAHGIEKIKTIGDAYMAASGVPVPCADHAQRAARAGLAMCKFLAERNRNAAFKWQLRVGLHSGPVVAGVVGKHKYAFDVWGDTVNIASRMESAGEIGRVNISAYTYDLIRQDFACEYRGKQTAKGKGEIDMYFVEAIA